MATQTFESPFGPMHTVSRDGALVAVGWGERPDDGGDDIVREAARQLAAYFDGRLKTFDLPLAPQGSDFRQRVWNAMATIPYGRTATYGDLARAVGSAPRAIGGACGANPLPIVIPCHRVVAANGTGGGYSGLGGIDTKSRLLAFERQRF